MVTTNLQLINSDPARIQADITRSELDPKVERTRLLDELGLHFPDNSPRDLVRLVIDRRSDLKINGHIIQTIIDGEGWLHARKLERLIEQDVQIEARHFKLLIPAQAQILSSLMWAEEEDSLVTKAIQDLTAKIESSGGSAEDIEEKIDYESTMIRRISFIKKLAAVLEIGEKFVEAQLNQGAPYASLKSELYNKLIARAGFYPESIGKVVDNFLTNNYDELGYVFLDTTLELVAAYNNLRRPSDPDLTASEVFSLLQPSLENEFLELFYDSRAITLQTEFTADFPRGLVVPIEDQSTPTTERYQLTEIRSKALRNLCESCKLENETLGDTTARVFKFLIRRYKELTEQELTMKEIRDKVCGTSQDGSDADFSIAQVLILGELNRNWLYSTEPGNAWQLVAIEDQLMLAATSR